MPRKQTDTVHLKLRFSEKLRRRIEAAADRNQQSMNAEIIHRLEQSFEKDDRVQLVETTVNKVAATLTEWQKWKNDVLALARHQAGSPASPTDQEAAIMMGGARTISEVLRVLEECFGERLNHEALGQAVFRRHAQQQRNQGDKS
jgi:hypothetical protein